jgi:hypothetical protein
MIINKLIQIGVIFITGILVGWVYEHKKLTIYKEEVKITAKAQELNIKTITERQKLINKGIEHDFQIKLASLRSRYDRLQHTSSSTMPAVPESARVVDAESADFVFACAATTQQLVSLQDWVNDQTKIEE